MVRKGAFTQQKVSFNFVSHIHIEVSVSNLRLGQLDLTSCMIRSSVLEGPKGSFLKEWEVSRAVKSLLLRDCAGLELSLSVQRWQNRTGGDFSRWVIGR